MTKQEAIEILRDTPIDIRSTSEDDIHTLYATAQGMAIEALKGKDTNVPSSCSEEPNKSDTIYRQDAIDAFGLSEKTRKYGGDHSGCDTMMLYEIQNTLESLPSANPDLSGYSDRLWKIAYDRGYERCKADAIDALRYAQHRFTVADEAGGMGTVKWSEDVIYFAAAERALTDLPSAQPDDFLEFLWNVINPNEMQRYLEMYWSGEEKTNG